MSVELLIPDIGDFSDVAVVDVLVKAGDAIELESPLVTLETDKATMDVPATAAGKITEVLLKRGDKVSKGSVIARVEAAGAGDTVRMAPARDSGDTVRMPPQRDADAAAAPALFYADWAHPIGVERSTLKAYRARLLARPSFARCIDDARPYRPFFPLGAPDRD